MSRSCPLLVLMVCMALQNCKKSNINGLSNKTNNLSMGQINFLPRMTCNVITDIRMNYNKFIWMLLGGHKLWIWRISSMLIDFILSLPCGWIKSIVDTRLATDRAGDFGCGTHRDTETAPLAVTIVADIDSGFGKAWDGAGLAADRGGGFTHKAATDSLTVPLSRTFVANIKVHFKKKWWLQLNLAWAQTDMGGVNVHYCAWWEHQCYQIQWHLQCLHQL